MSKINKALDLNKLLSEQAKGKLLKKVLKFPLYAGTVYDGNYVTIKVESGNSTVFTTSGGHNYVHLDTGGDVFNEVVDGVYLAERIHGKGKLGDRVRCNLKGPKGNQTSTGHSYRVFDYLTLDEYGRGYSISDYSTRVLDATYDLPNEVVKYRVIGGKDELDAYLKEIVNEGYEGLMLMDPNWKWEATTSRRIDFCKYKSRPTADLLCIGTTEGEGKYKYLVGALILQDSKGRIVNVGSGLSDPDRHIANAWVGEVIEINYEQIIDTYIQPSFNQVRWDKSEEEID